MKLEIEKPDSFQNPAFQNYGLLLVQNLKSYVLNLISNLSITSSFPYNPPQNSSKSLLQE